MKKKIEEEINVLKSQINDLSARKKETAKYNFNHKMTKFKSFLGIIINPKKNLNSIKQNFKMKVTQE